MTCAMLQPTCQTGAPAFQASSSIDDEIAALTLQLEEISTHDDVGLHRKGKFPAGSPPDAVVAFASFRAELESCVQVLENLKLAHSVAHAVDTDGPVIAELTGLEARAALDRDLALRMNAGSEDLENLPQHGLTAGRATTGSLSTIAPSTTAIDPEDNGEMYAGSLYQFIGSWLDENNDDEDGSVGAGPSMTYAERQAQLIGRLGAQDTKCCACLEKFRPCDAVRLRCNDTYCKACLRNLFTHATTDLELFPPRCCRQTIPLKLVEAELSVDELVDFHNTAIEIVTRDKTYCSGPACGRFVPPSQIIADRAECARCGTATCTNCKNAFHADDCPYDPALQATLQLARDQGCQRCFSCRAVVELISGCNHMTCNCGAEFCYVCGEEWTDPKTCACDAWDEHLILRRGEEIVDREHAGPAPLPARERELRIGNVVQELRERHECRHPGRFERLFGGPRRGFRCESCEDRHWKYILQCRHCHFRVCEDCRRNRIR